jgi:hypothetical protein
VSGTDIRLNLPLIIGVLEGGAAAPAPLPMQLAYPPAYMPSGVVIVPPQQPMMPMVPPGYVQATRKSSLIRLHFDRYVDNDALLRVCS